MKLIKLVQTFAAAGILAAGCFAATRAHASECSQMANWGYNSPRGGDCLGMGHFTSGDQGAPNSYITADLEYGYGGYTPDDAFIYGLDSQGHFIQGCSAIDYTADGQSVGNNQGCQPGQKIVWVVQYH